MRGLVSLITPADQPLELQIVGRTLLHAALVGLGAGILGCAFFAAAELLQNILLEQLAGYAPLRAQGERLWGAAAAADYRWWLLAIIPAVGALVGAVTGAGPDPAHIGAVYAVIYAILLGGATALVLLVLRVRRLKDPIPYGPFLCAGAAIILYQGP